MSEADKIIADLKRLEPKLREKGVTHLSIFGSRSRGDHGPESDLDVLIDLQKGQRYSLLKLAGVGHIIEDELGFETSVVVSDALRDEFRIEIAPDVKKVF
jgi:uncharacterized protein